MKKLLFLLFPLFINAQDVGIGQWKDYLSYNSASYICEANEKIYCVANGGLYYVNTSDGTINRLSKITGLSDIGVKKVAYSKELDVTVISYENCNIDLIKNNQIINISDIKRKEIIGTKAINNITVNNEIAYLSTSFGLLLLDLTKEEIKDTYKIGENGNIVGINDCYIDDTCIFVGTTDGAYFADKNSNTLFNFNSWTKHPSYTTEVSEIIVNSLGILFNNQYPYVKVRKSNGYYLEIGNILSIYQNGNLISEIIEDSNFSKIQDAWIDQDDNLWVADSVNGLLKFIDFEYVNDYSPSGPKSNTVFNIEFINSNLYNCHGGHLNFGHLWNKDGVSIMNNFEDWRNYNYTELGNARDIVSVAKVGNKTYFASYYNGISELEDDEFSIRYGYENTNGALDTINNWANDRRLKISDLEIDSYGNLWGLNSNVNNPLFVRKLNGEWHSFTMNQSVANLLFDDLLIDSYNQKWGIMGRGAGIFVYNDNNTIGNPNDDQYKILSTNIGNGNLPSLQTYCFAEDLEGEIWVGTDNGITVFYDPGAVFSGYNFDAQQILITEGEYGQYLLSEEKVKCITIDGANRKWIGTEKSGVFLLSEDGTEEILHFTKNNSPLFSDNIIDIVINPENGEVFIGTENGLISYRSDATEGVLNQSNTKVFPNPVKESYNGPIAISGLVPDANIKITDISGNLVFETFANGGQAIWNGKNKKGMRSSTGVYLVFSTDLYGEQKMVSKILFIH
jgi:ligand-binding sensor domain-containing protein